MLERDPMALALFAAWVNLPVDKLPPEMRGHTCAATMEAWGRVADAARSYVLTAMREPTPEMVEAGQQCEGFGGDGGQIYRAMIDKALEE